MRQSANKANTLGQPKATPFVYKDLVMINIVKIIPHIPSTDMEVTKEFFINLFGFKVVTDSGSFITLNNNEYTLGILKALSDPNEQSVYIQVSEIEKLWANLKDKINRYKHKALFTQDYGMTEFHVIIPKTATLLFVGEPANA